MYVIDVIYLLLKNHVTLTKISLKIKCFETDPCQSYRKVEGRVDGEKMMIIQQNTIRTSHINLRRMDGTN